jgi:hypothetical protein
VKYAVTSRGTLISIDGSIVLPASGLTWPATSFSLQWRGILRSRVDGESGKDKPQTKHRDEHKDGEPSPPSFCGPDVRNGRIGACAHATSRDPPKWQRTQKRQLASLDVHEFALKPPQVYNDRQKTCRFACKRRAELAMIFAI